MHTDRREIIDWSLRLSTAGDWERYAASPRWGRYLEVAYGATIHLPLPEILEPLDLPFNRGGEREPMRCGVAALMDYA